MCNRLRKASENSKLALNCRRVAHRFLSIARGFRTRFSVVDFPFRRLPSRHFSRLNPTRSPQPQRFYSIMQPTISSLNWSCEQVLFGPEQFEGNSASPILQKCAGMPLFAASLQLSSLLSNFKASAAEKALSSSMHENISRSACPCVLKEVGGSSSPRRRARASPASRCCRRLNAEHLIIHAVIYFAHSVSMMVLR